MRKCMRFLCAAAVLCLLFAVPFTAAAETANAYLAFSANTVTVGDTVTVTASFTASSIGAVSAAVYYDPAVMEFVSGSNAAGGNGTVNLAAAATADGSSMKFPLTFKAIAAGNCTFSIGGAEVISWDYAALGSPSAGATMKVQAVATTTTTTTTTTKATTTTTTTRRPTTTTTTRRPTGTTTGSTTTTVPTVLTIDGVTYTAHAPDKADIPAGFTADPVQFGTQTLSAFRSENEAITLVYLSADGADTAWYIADTAADTVYPFCPLTVDEHTYYLLPAETPDGFTETTVTQGETAFAVFAFSDAARADFAVFYAMNGEGSIGWYCWDTVENTVQRYIPLTTSATTSATTTTSTTKTTVVAATTTTAAPFTLATLTSLPWIVAGGLLLVCIALLILVLILRGRALPNDTHHTPRH